MIQKDKNTSMVFNSDLSAYEQLKEKRETNKKFETIINEIKNLKQDVEILKEHIHKCAQSQT